MLSLLQFRAGTHASLGRQECHRDFRIMDIFHDIQLLAQLLRGLIRVEADTVNITLKYHMEKNKRSGMEF